MMGDDIDVGLKYSSGTQVEHQMSEIVVRRKAALWRDRSRNYRIFVDGTEAAKVANGKEVGIPVLPGEHVVVLKIDWCKSNPIQVEVQPGKVNTLECGPNGTPLLALLFITLLRNRYLWLRLSDNSVATAQEAAPTKR